MEVDRIGEVFKNKTVFISGATGFLGKVLIEKLLRVTDVKTLYLLVRQKKNTCPKDRITDIFNHVLFSVVKKERPDSFKKCVIITGDVLETDLGIIEVERDILRNEVDFIVHSAASTRFDDTIPYAVKMNTLGTKYMLDLAKECKKLQLFIHISTAFAFPDKEVLYEKPYDPPMDPQKVLDILSTVKGVNLDKCLVKELLGDCPNTYTYSKALAEGLVNEQLDKLPIIIVRPAVVIPTYEEPFPGYYNNLQSPMGIFVGAGKGVIRSVRIDSKTNANLVPADCTINGLLACAWYYLKCQKEQKVFNLCLPQEDLQMTWEEIVELGKEVSSRIPFNQLLWYPNGILTKSKWVHNLHVLLFQLIPAVFVDLLLLVLGYKPVLIGVNQRLIKGQVMFDYFTNRPWKFSMKGFLNMRTKLNAVERKRYRIHADNIDIARYLENCMMYTRKYIFKDSDDSLPRARTTLKILYVVDRAVKIAFFVTIFYYLYKALSLYYTS